MKIDIHLHLLLERPAQREPGSGGGAEIGEAAEMLPYLKELGIGHGILMSGGERESVLGSNRNNQRICQKFPGQYSWMCNLDEREPETVFKRLEACKTAGAVGVGELMVNRRLDHPFLESIFRAAEQLSMPVLFHMSPEEGFSYGVVDHPGLPLLEQALKAHPGLLLIGHSQPFWHEISGNVTGGRQERNSWGEGPVSPGGRLLSLFEEYPNLYGDLSANSGGCAVMRDQVFGLSFLEKYQDRLLFGTDMVNAEMTFPLGPWLDLRRAEGRLSGEAYEKICHGNAERIFQIPREGNIDGHQAVGGKRWR